MAYEINYDDKRFTQVESDKKEALSDLENTYAGMIDNSDKYYQAQIDASKQWADKQTELQNAQTDFAIQEIEQQKAQAKKDYTKEQSGAYVDWQKQSNQYGANAEAMAAQGMVGSGYSESSQVAMYNTYQNRVTAARESYNLAIQNYNNSITEARLQNNAVLAEIAYQSLQQQLELSLQGFQYKNQLITEQADKKLQISEMYHQRYQDVLKQINTENALAEEVRQFNKNYDLNVKKLDEEIRQYNQTYELNVKELDEKIRQFNEEIARLKAKDSAEAKQAAQELEIKKQQVQIQKQQLAEEKRQFNAKMAEEKRQFNVQNGAKGTTSSKGSSSGSSSGSKTSTSSKSLKSLKSSSSSKKAVHVDDVIGEEKSAGAPTVDMKSVLALGFGPISESKLNGLVKSGVVQEYVSGGKIKFKLSSSALKQSMLFGGGRGGR